MVGRADTDQRVVADRYALREQIGRGGTGTVWRADDLLLERQVAVKEVALPISSADGDEAQARARVLREARAAARLSHPSAVTVYDVVEEDDRVYLVMELVDAPTLSEYVVAKGPLSPAEAARIGIEVLGPLEAAHAEGIVHRDVKPSNVLVTGQPGAKLADFGIASVRDDPSLTRTGMLLGSPPYMAPEQAEGQGIGPATDMWGLGATLYFAVEGRPPFGPGDPLPTLMSVVNEEPAPPRRAGPLGPVIEELLAKDARERPTPAAARALLEDVASGDRAATTATATAPMASPSAWADEPLPVGAVDRVEPATQTERVPAPAAVRRRRMRLPVVLMAVIVVAVAAIAAAAALSGKNEGSQNAAAPASTAPTTAGKQGRLLTYRDAAAGWSLAYPAGWRVTRSGTQTRFDQPGTGTYLLVDYTNSPGNSPLADWQAQSKAFGGSHAGYQQIDLSQTTYKGHPAAAWEYAYDAGGARLHAVDLGFVTAQRGYALNFQTHEADWSRAQSLFEHLKADFNPGA